MVEKLEKKKIKFQWPTGGGLQEQPSNYPAVLSWQRDGIERTGKRLYRRGQVGVREMNENEPLMKCREIVQAAKTVVSRKSRDKYSDYLFIGYAAVVMKRA